MTVYTGARLSALEHRIGRHLTAAERHMQVETIDALLNQAKDLLEAEIVREQARAVALIADGVPARLEVTHRMLAILRDLRAHGEAHARGELASMGYDLVAEARRFANPADELEQRLRARLANLTIKIQAAEVGLDLSVLAGAAVEKALVKVLGARSIAADLVAPAFDAGLGATFEQHAGLVEAWQVSAILDGSTCSPCADDDGSIYDSWDAIQEVLPNGGPNVNCDGGDRCRCRALPVPPEG